MNDDIDIEETLQRYPSDPGPRVKRSVLSRFARTVGSGRTVNHSAGLWKRPIPLYAAVATMVIVVGLSFFAGQKSSSRQRPVDPSPKSPQTLKVTTIPEVTWEVAPNDIL